MIVGIIVLAAFVVALCLGFWAGHQVGFDEGLTHASKGAYWIGKITGSSCSTRSSDLSEESKR